ncbi:MAG: phosphatidate cytidylyltransferase [Clostridia bacterium]|nr:phosphatidate cytidylyltransferase [Clostridia bacterium]
MKQRIVTGIVGLAVAIPILWFSYTLVFPLALALCGGLGAFELLRCIGEHKKPYHVVPACLFGFLMPFLTHFLYRESVNSYVLFMAICSFALILWFFACTVFLNTENAFSKMAQVAVGTVYVTVGFVSMGLLRRMPGGEMTFGLVLVIAWGTDIAAYFSGVFLGKHKLCPKISPKKTVEGSIGGVLGCCLLCLLYGFLAGKAFHVTPVFPSLIIGGAILSVVSQVGALAASVIKREYGVKDYGKLLPGHGGILDRFDSLIAVAPVLLLLCTGFSRFAFFA